MIITRSIRSQLILAFMGVVFLSLSGISLILFMANTRAVQQENERQLSTVASYKGKALREWANALQSELDNVLIAENMQPAIESVLFVPAGGTSRAAVSAAREALRIRLVNLVAQSRYYNEYMLLNTNGSVAISTLKARDGQDFSESDFYQAGRTAAYIGEPIYSTGQSETLLYVAYPIYGRGRVLIGVLVGRAKTNPLETVFNDPTGFREPGVTYLASAQGSVISGSQYLWRGRTVTGLQQTFGQSPPNDGPQVGNYSNLDNAGVTGAYLRIPELHGVLVIEQTNSNLVRAQLAGVMVNLSVILSSVILALYIALMATRSIAIPLQDLADVATAITERAAISIDQSDGTGPQGEETTSPGTATALMAAGEDLRQRIGPRGDEIGVLAHDFSLMTSRLAGLVGNLEAIVTDRTRQLATRTAYLEASADIGRVTNSILDPEKLLNQAVELIRDRFEMYYVGLFLTDRDAEWAILRSGTGEAGRIMLARSHRLRIEPTSMIGWCIANAQARIAQVASDDEVRAVTTELPETRSEAALPLRARGHVLGALSVQSSLSNAFDNATLAVLQTMADQLATTIENAQLFAQSTQALEAERRAYAVSAQTDWRDWMRLRSGLTLRSDPTGVMQLDAPERSSISPQSSISPRNSGSASNPSTTAWPAEMQQAYAQGAVVQHGSRLAIPIRVRGAVIGVIQATHPSHNAAANSDGHNGQPHSSEAGWTNTEVSFIDTIAEQLGVALDSARLYAETRQRSEQDRLVDEITGRMRATLDLRSVLETTASELRDALGLAEVEVRLGQGEMGKVGSPSPDSQGHPDSPGRPGSPGPGGEKGLRNE